MKTQLDFKTHYSPKRWSIFTAVILSVAMIGASLMPACSTAQLASSQATVTDALNAGALITQGYVSLKTPVPASALQTGNSKVDNYLATATNVLSAPPTQALVNDLFALAAKNPATVPVTSP